MEFSKKQAFKNNKKSNLETLFLKFHAELRGEIKIPTKFIKFALKQNGSFQESPMQIEGRELFPLQTYCCSKASISQKTCNAKVKIWVCFFFSISFKIKRELEEMVFLHFWKKAMLLFKLFPTGIDWHLKKKEESKLQNIAYELLGRIYRPN